jgi:hypothetical protein
MEITVVDNIIYADGQEVGTVRKEPPPSGSWDIHTAFLDALDGTEPIYTGGGSKHSCNPVRLALDSLDELVRKLENLSCEIDQIAGEINEEISNIEGEQ